MSEEVLVSVIIPVYNASLSLKDCIESILDQSFSRLELILVDDGSSDNSVNICDEYSSNNTCIRVIHKKIKVYHRLGMWG